MFNVICFGETLWDNFKDGKKPGGAPMNVALHLHKHGIKSELITSVGRDENGLELLDFLQQQGLELRSVQQHPSLPTGLVEVELDEQKQARYTITEPVAWDDIEYHDELKGLVGNADAIVFGSLASRQKGSRSTILKLLPYAKFRVFDMNLRPPHFSMEILSDLMKYCDLLKINEDELSFLEDYYHLHDATTTTNLKKLSALLGIPSICVTLGGKGAVILRDGEIYTHPGFSVKVADTVGAGDAFLAAYIGGYLRKLPASENLELACAAGALVASRHGANPPYSYEEIKNHSFTSNTDFSPES